MSMQLMEMVLPRLEKRLRQHVERYQNGQLSDDEFARRFAKLLEQQHSWLANRGVAEEEAVLAIYGAVLVLSGPGMVAEAGESGTPLEVIEHRAVQAAADDIAKHYPIRTRKAYSSLSAVVSRYGVD